MRLKVAAQTTLEPEIAEKPPHPKIVVIHSTIYDFLNNYHLGLIPLFIAVGNLAGRTGIIRDFYAFLAILLRKVPGSRLQLFLDAVVFLLFLVLV